MPVGTYEDRIYDLFHGISEIGFKAIDLWVGHLHYTWDFNRHIEIMKKMLDRYNFEVVSYAGGFGESLEAFEKACILCHELDIPVLGGIAPLISSDKQGLVKLLEKYDIQLAFENHPEKTPNELINKIGSSYQDYIGITLDTGWFASNGYDSSEAIYKLSNRIKHIHLKDILERDTHKCCELGKGIVDIKGCVNALKNINYSGAISVEIEKEQGSPIEDITNSKLYLQDLIY
jgi:sugar phosphate isomerase/epimerase